MRAVGFLITFMLAVPATAEVEQGRPNVPHFTPAYADQTRAPEDVSSVRTRVSWFALGLVHPWGIAPLPEGGFLVTERPGNVRYVGPEGQISDPVTGVPEVFSRRQGGLLDVALSPDFGRSRLVYLSYAKPLGGGRSATAVAMGRLSDDLSALQDVQDIFVQDPSSLTPMHYGSRIAFDGAGHVFVTLGEHSSPDERVLAQDTGTTFGKVVRLKLDGSVPADNPFGNAVWSYGHRNPQGAFYDMGKGQLWTLEHGPAGGDELNRIEAGANYGWPVISYGENYNGSPVGQGITAQDGMEQPVYYWDPVIAPSGFIKYDGVLFPEWEGDFLIASLNPGGLVRLSIENGRVTGEERFFEGTRIRDVDVAPDGAVLLLVDDPRGGVLRITRD